MRLARPSASEEIPGALTDGKGNVPGGWSHCIWRYLHRMAWLENQLGPEKRLFPYLDGTAPSSGALPIASADEIHRLKTEYRRLELEGAFLNEAQ